MPVIQSTKAERMYIRLDTQAKKKIEKAAAYSHKTLSEFVLSQALVSANKVINENESLALSESDFSLFLDALDTPGEPNQKLKNAFRLHSQKTVRNHK